VRGCSAAPFKMAGARVLLLLMCAAALAAASDEASNQPEPKDRAEPTFGLSTMQHVSGCVELTDVSRSSKAAACHFKPQDLVCAFNGSLASTLTSAQLASLPQKTTCDKFNVRKHAYV